MYKKIWVLRKILYTDLCILFIMMGKVIEKVKQNYKISCDIAHTG